jgi:hypothetical protein
VPEQSVELLVPTFICTSSIDLHTFVCYRPFPMHTYSHDIPLFKVLVLPHGTPRAPTWHDLALHVLCFERGAGSTLPQYRNSHALFSRICVIILRRSRRPTWNAQEDMMDVCIVHGRLMVKDLSYSMIQMLKRCQVEIEIYHTINGKAGTNHVIV